MKPLFVMDPLAKLNKARDSSLFMMSLFSEITWVSHCDADGIVVADTKIRYHQHDFASLPDIQMGPERFIAWGDVMGWGFFRLDPPVGEEYRRVASLWATAGSHVALVNNPMAISSLSEKMIPLVGGHEIKFFTHGRAYPGDILKSLWGFGGTSVIRVEEERPLDSGEMAQEFCADVEHGEDRVFILGKEIVGSLRKIPASGEFRTNSQFGSHFQWEKVSRTQGAIAEFYQDWLAKHGVTMATVDFLGDRVLEVNITCPGLLYLAAVMGAGDEIVKGIKSLLPAPK